MNFTTFLSARDAVADYQAHPDFRTIASFTLGWVFLLACRHVVHAPFTHTIGRAFCAAFDPAHQRLEDVESTNKPLSLMHMNLADVASSLEASDGSAGQRFIAFLLFWALIVSSLTQFLSLVAFENGLGYESLCAATLGLGTASSVTARVLGILALSLELRHRFQVTIYELAPCWFLLISAMGITGGTIFFSLGQVTVLPNLGTAICVKQHFMPTSLTVSLILISLELYTLARLLIGLSLPRGVLDVRVSRVAALLVFDLAVIVPDAIASNVLGDFIPFSVGAVIVLAAFAPTSIRGCERILLASSKGSTTSPRSSVMQSSFFEPPQPIHMAQPPRTSPALSERAMNELLMNGPSYGGPTPMRRLSDQERRKRESLRPLSFTAKQLPKLPPASLAEQTDTEGPRSDVATIRSSMTRAANSAEGAILATATRETMPPGLAVAMPVTTPTSSVPLSGKILQPEQLAAYDRAASSNVGSTSAGLAPPPRSAIRPQLAIDTSGRNRNDRPKSKRESRRVSFLNVNSSSTPGHLAPPPVLDVSAVPSRDRSMVSPANMVTSVPIGPRRSSPSNTPRTTAMRSPEAASLTFTMSARSSVPNSAPALHGEVAFVGDDDAPVIFAAANSAAAARKSATGTFGRRSTRGGARERLPDVPHTPTDAESLPDPALVQAPGPWIARSVQPLRLHRGPGVGVRGPRARPPTSAPPM